MGESVSDAFIFFMVDDGADVAFPTVLVAQCPVGSTDETESNEFLFDAAFSLINFPFMNRKTILYQYFEKSNKSQFLEMFPETYFEIFL